MMTVLSLRQWLMTVRFGGDPLGDALLASLTLTCRPLVVSTRWTSSCYFWTCYTLYATHAGDRASRPSRLILSNRRLIGGYSMGSLAAYGILTTPWHAMLLLVFMLRHWLQLR